MKYCPKCSSEFNDSIKLCATHQIKLTSHKPSVKYELLIDIYLAANEFEAERINALLQEAEIESYIAHSSISQIPLRNNNDYLIAVSNENKKKALELIQTAISDQIISGHGKVLK